MESFFALLAICAGNSVTGEFPTERSVTRSLDVFFDLRLNKRLGKQWWAWLFEMPLRPLWLHRNVLWTFTSVMWIQCKLYSERPRGAGFKSVNPAERWRENTARALARAGFSQHLECGIHRSESSPEKSFALIPHPLARWAKTTP